MMLMKRALAVGGLALGGLAMATGPASAAVGATIDSVDRAGCELTVNVTVEDAGTYALAVFDDDVELGGSSVEAAAGETIQLTYTITSNVNDQAPGLGLYVFDAPEDPRTLLADIDPYDFPGSDSVAAACAASGGTDSGEGIPEVTIPSSTVPSTTAVTPTDGSAPSNAEAPSSGDDVVSTPEVAAAPALQPKFTG